MCMFLCALCLDPATPGWDVRRGCVCLGSGFGCAQPLLSRVLGCVCARAPAPLVPRHSWLGCAAWVCGLWLGFRLRPASPGRGVGVCMCLCARSACTPPLLAGVCGVGVCVWARVSAAPCLSWLGCWGVCVFLCALRLYPANSGWCVRRGCVCLGLGLSCPPPLVAGLLGRVCVCVPAPLVLHHSWLGRVVCVCVCLGSGFGCAPPLLAGLLGCVCVRVPALNVPRHSWPGRAPWVCVLWLGFRLRPATPGWVVGVCACSCARSACTPPLLSGVCGVGVFLGLGSGCAPPLLAGVSGCVCVRVPAPLVPRHSWLGCAAWVCVLGLGFRLRLASPSWVVGVCVCSCARSACSPPLFASVCGVCVCVRARVSAAPRHSGLGCGGVCVFVCPLRLYAATPGCGVRPGCV